MSETDKKTPKAPPQHPACVVKMARDFEISGGSFDRLTPEKNDSRFDEDRGIIHYEFRGVSHRMSIHSAAVLSIALK
jgi:hypothetical protein